MVLVSPGFPSCLSETADYDSDLRLMTEPCERSGVHKAFDPRARPIKFNHPASKSRQFGMIIHRSSDRLHKKWQTH
jgi:hypothetical protein